MTTTKIVDGFTGEASPFIKVDFATPFTMAKESAGSTAFGRVKDGTVMGKITATGKVRPCGNTKCTLGQSSATIKVDNAKNFFIGDLIDVESLGAVGTKTFDANAVPETITLTGLLKDGLAHTVQLIDPSANDQLIRVEVTVAAGVYTIKVYLATGGAGAITSKPADVVAALNAAVGHIMVATNSANTTAVTAVAAQTLAGGIAEGALLLNGVAITGVDKTSSQQTITTGTSIASETGCYVRLDNGAETAIGLIVNDANSYLGMVDEDGTPITSEPAVSICMRGVVDESLLPVALSAAQKADLGDHFILL